MKFSGLQILLAILLAVAAGCIGAFAAGEWRATTHPRTLHDFVHEELDSIYFFLQSCVKFFGTHLKINYSNQFLLN